MADAELATENVANECEAPDDMRATRYGRRKRLFLMWICTERVYVWADHFDDAFEELVEWADDNARGCLVTVGIPELKEAADNIGMPWNDDWPDYEDSDFEKVVQEAESDLTSIGHTTLKHGNYVASHEWGGTDIDDIREIELVARHSQELCSDHDFMVGDYVWFTNDDGDAARYIVESINGGNIDIESIPPGDGWTMVSHDDLAHFDPAVHHVKPKRFRTKESWADDDSFDGLNEDDTWEESFRTEDRIDVHLFVFRRGGSVGYILTIERPRQKPQVVRGSTEGDLREGVVAGRRALIRALSQKPKKSGLAGLFSFGRRR